MDCLIHPTCFSNLAHFVAMIKAKAVYFEVCDNYQKQTYRNRTEIYSANGKLALSIPVIYTQKNRQLYKDVKIANTNIWQQQHLKSLQSTYRMSPFFEFYIDDLIPLFEKQFDYILDYNIKCFEVLTKNLQVNINFYETKTFEKEPKEKVDYRYLVNRKSNSIPFTPYTQVFTEKHGFITNLSILDLLFNEGPNSEFYLKKQVL